MTYCGECGKELSWREDNGKPRWVHKTDGMAVCNISARSRDEVRIAKPITVSSDLS